MTLPADATLQSGQLSDFAFAKQTAFGTYTAPTDIFYAQSFDIPRTANIIVADALAGSFDSEVATRAGAGSISAKLTGELWSVQGMPLVKGSVGFDTMSGATATSLGTIAAGGTAVGDQSITLTAAIAATPAGINSWCGFTMLIDGGGANPERLPILEVPTTTSIKTLPLQFAHAAAATIQVEVAHCFQPNVGTNKANLDWFSLVGQWGSMLERRVQDMRIAKFGLKGDSEKITTSYDFVGETDIVAETSTLTTLPSPTNEANDTFYIEMDGGLIIKNAATDTAPTVRHLLTAFSYDLTYSTSPQKTGGSRAAVVRNVFTKRMQALTWSELNGQYGSVNTIRQDFVNTQTPQKVYLWFYNPAGPYAICAYFPNAVVTAYDPVGPSANPISYNGSIKILPDNKTEKLAVRITVLNGTTVAL